MQHCERSGGGFWFDGYAQFEAVLDRLVADADLRTTLAERGVAYVEHFYRWPALADRYRAFLELTVSRAMSAANLTPKPVNPEPLNPTWLR